MAECKGGCGTVLTGRQWSWCSDQQCRKLALQDAWLRKIYGISLEDRDALIRSQGGVCAICKRPPQRGRVLAIDHEHREEQAGPIRGGLCYFCNRFLIGARSADYIFSAAEYLANPPAQQLWGERWAPGRPKKKRQPRKRKR